MHHVETLPKQIDCAVTLRCTSFRTSKWRHVTWVLTYSALYRLRHADGRCSRGSRRLSSASCGPGMATGKSGILEVSSGVITLGGVLVLAVAMRDPQEFCYLAPAPLDMWGHCGRCGSTGRYKIRYCGWNLPESLRRSPEGGGDVQEDARVASCIQCGSDSADKTPSGKWLQIIHSAL